MAVAMIGPKFYAWDRNGKPLAFGKLYTYQARTNIPKATYQSEDKVVENTNPVILNGEGYANIYLDGSYKMVLKDDDENEIWTSDPVSSNQVNEWVNCISATYVNPTSFKLVGNYAAEYDKGRSVRLSDGGVNYIYSVIKSSVFAASETTVTVENPVVMVGLLESCVSIVGPNSTGVNISDARYGASFSTRANLALGTSIDGGSVVFSEGDTAKVVGEDGAVEQYTIISGGALPDILLAGGLWARSLNVRNQKAANSPYSSPIISAPISGTNQVVFWANAFSQNMIVGDGGASMNDAASGTKDGNNNTGFGFGAFRNATTSFACAAFGFSSLNAMTTGDSNTAFGYQSLARLTTGKNNTGVGVDAGYNITTGSNNTLVGRHVAFEGSGLTNLTGSDNAMLGYDVALGCTTMAEMCVMGSLAHRDGTTSARSVIIGKGAAQDINTVNDSVIIGRQAIQNIPAATVVTSTIEIGARVNENALSANSNAIVGYTSFFTLAQPASATSFNAALGGEAGSRIYGSRNTIMGYRAGAYAVDTELNDAVLIGYRAGDGTAISDDFIVANSQNSVDELIKGNFGTKAMRIEATAMTLRNLPTVGTGASGTLWNDSGTVKVVA